MEGLFPEITAGNSNAAQILVMTGLYGYVLFVAANMIGDGAELLLLVPKLAPLVGSIVLPILGAVPDGLMVLFSGLGEREEAIGQLSVGMGAMAGSSVMLLTMPWFLSVLSGRVSIVDGKPNYVRKADEKASEFQKLKADTGIFQTCVGVGDTVKSNAKLMILTCLTYVVIQGPAFLKDGNQMISDPQDTWPNGVVPEWYEEQAKFVKIPAYLSMLACIGFFITYLVLMYKAGNPSKRVEVTIAYIRTGTVTLRGALEDELKERRASSSPGLGDKLINDEDEKDLEHLNGVLKPFFKRYDADSSGSVSQTEFMVLLADLGVLASFDEKKKIFEAADEDRSGTIDMKEFVKCTLKLVLADWTKAEVEKKGNKDEEPEEEDDMPEDLAMLTPAEQQKRIKKRAGMKLLIGSLLVLVFSDPMCDMLGVIGDLVKIPKFYVAFLLAPLASNASELIAAMKLAAKKSEKSMVDSLSSLEGAAVMNNTFCMAIFVFLIIYQNLAFTYKAETAAIIFVEVLIGALALKGSVMKFLDGCIVLACYPLCLGLVLFLENVCHLD